ncbi:hypothetical protein EDD73_10731 [Heliophilum fasciatum]|uniref:Uncharacterized protein n=1 Tax=Heliophilum fasciatum TaxID=35700 RepID=A0A4R2RY84_9FIRM|nr:hypothetical protein [Heliophilum fasciatum]TCP64961.1 hypothetical protein EDD73_10731 [Heliophilum fasciatum]
MFRGDCLQSEAEKEKKLKKYRIPKSTGIQIDNYGL